ncbi:MAG TPA: formate/nitrite transporter family protein [Candidatus Hypogeohydataceae bacterium YC41]
MPNRPAASEEVRTDYVNPTEILADCLKAAEKKALLSIPEMLVKGALSGVFLGFATSLVMVILAQGLPPIAGAAAFPVGFVILVLLGLELVTGNFALMPQGLAAGHISTVQLLRNWGWVYLGNLLGSLFYAVLFYLAITNFGTNDGGAIGEQIRLVAKKKTLAYSAIGHLGWGSAVVKGILCNWMVTIGTMMAFVSRSTVGKVVVMWLPIMIFFAHGYEHCVVNMYVIPSAMFLGAPITIADWWVWNQIPVTLGNIFSGAVFTGLALLFLFGSKKSEVPVSKFSMTSCVIGCFLLLGVIIFSVTVWSETPKHQLEEGLIAPLGTFLPVYLIIFAVALIVTSLVAIIFGSLGIMQILGKPDQLRGKALAASGIIMSILTIIPPATKLPSFVRNTLERQDLEEIGIFKLVRPGIFEIIFEPENGAAYSMGMGFQTKYGIVTCRHMLDEVKDVNQLKFADAFRVVKPFDKGWIFDRDKELDLAIIPQMTKGTQILELADTAPKVGDPVLYVSPPVNGDEYLPVQGKIKTVYREPKSNVSYLIIETASPAVVGSPVIDNRGKVVGLFVATAIGEGLAISVRNDFLKDEFALASL